MDEQENLEQMQPDEFDLDDILNEFRVEPEECSEETPVLPEEQPTLPEEQPILPEEEPEEAAADQLAPEHSLEEPEQDQSALEQTQNYEPLLEETEAVTASLEDDTKVLEPEQPEPAFEVEEEFKPAPILFNPRSRLRELKKQLVAGPEKRYYALSETGVGKLQTAIVVCAVVVAFCGAITGMFAMDSLPERRLRLVVFSQVLSMLICGLMGSSLMVDSIADLLKGRFNLNTLLTISFGVCLADSLFSLQEERVPCCAAFCLEMTMALWARLQRYNIELGQMDTMRKATRLNGVFKAANYYEGGEGILRTEGQVDDFMKTYNKPAAPERAQTAYALLALIVCVAIALFAGMLHGVSMGVRILSTSLLVAVPASFFVSYTRPMAILENRLHMVGTVHCGWQGIKGLCGKAVVPLQDQDLFPHGSTKLNGVKFYTDRDADEVVSYSTSLIAVAGGDLVGVFRQLLKSRGGVEQRVTQFRNYGDGGIGGMVCGEPVLLGTLDFMQDMGVEVPEGTMVNQAVYAAIDGELCAVYAISYARMRSAAAGLVTLCSSRKLKLLKFPGDFMLTENFLQSKFGIKTKRMSFLDWETAKALEQYEPDPEAPILAMTTRDELVSMAYAITGARAIRQAARLGLAIHLIGGILGMLIMLALGYLGSTELLTPVNVLLYQIIWAVPGLLVTEWTRTV